MTNAARTSGLPNPSTGDMRLFDVARWLIAILVVHFIIARASRLAAALHKSYGPDDAFLAHFFGTTDRDQILARMTRALDRAAALEDELRTRRPLEQGFSNETRQAYAAQINDICRALGFFPSERPASRPLRTIRRGRFQTCPDTAAPTAPIRRISTAATGPPQRTPLPLRGRGRRNAPGEGAANGTLSPPTRVYPWSVSRRAPASAYQAPV